MSMYKNSNTMRFAGVAVFVLLVVGVAFAPVLSANVVHAADLGGGESFLWGDVAMSDPVSTGFSGGESYGGESGGWYNDDYSMGGLCDYDCYGGYDDYGYDDYGYSGGDYYGSGGGYSMGGGSFSMPRTYSTGGGYIVTPRSYSPAQPSGGGSQHQNQTQSTSVSNNVTNTNTNTNINNNTAIAVVQVGAQTAQQPNYPTYPSYPTYPTPYCTINQAQSFGGYGYNRPVYLSWNSSNAQSAYLSGYGSVAVNGSQTVYTTYSQTYTLTVYGYNGQQATCQTTVNTPTYVPPTVPTTPYVSLTQIPYTGFDFGTFGNAMYFAAIAILALGGAYMAVYFIPQVALAARGSSKRSFQPVVAPKAPILVEKEAAEAKFNSFVAALNKKGTNDTMAIVQEAGSMPKIVIDRS